MRARLCFGVVVTGSQSLLFRAYFSAFAGHLLCVGLFFAMACFWVAVGLWWRRRRGDLPRRSHTQLSQSLLLFIPALSLAYLLIVTLRPLVALTGMALFSLPSLMLWTLVVTAPVSLVTGRAWFDFSWLNEEQDNPPLFCPELWQGAGAVLGGCITAGLFHLKISPLGALLVFTALVCLAVPGVSGLRNIQKVCLTVMGVLLLAGMAVGEKQGIWLDSIHRIQWGAVASRRLSKNRIAASINAGSITRSPWARRQYK